MYVDSRYVPRGCPPPRPAQAAQRFIFHLSISHKMIQTPHLITNMQTGGSSKAAATEATSSRKHSTAAVAVTPSPQRKKTKRTHNRESISPMMFVSLPVSSTRCANNLREEMTRLVWSHLMDDAVEGGDFNRRTNVDTKTIRGWW